MLKPVYAALLLAGTGLGLAACSDSAETPSEIAPEGIAGLEITNPRMMLPPVAGNPAAVYFDIAYDGERNLALRSADVAGADGVAGVSASARGGAVGLSRMKRMWENIATGSSMTGCVSSRKTRAICLPIATLSGRQKGDIWTGLTPVNRPLGARR